METSERIDADKKSQSVSEDFKLLWGWGANSLLKPQRLQSRTKFDLISKA